MGKAREYKDCKRYSIVDEDGTILGEYDNLLVRDNTTGEYLEFTDDDYCDDANHNTFMKVYLDGVSRFFGDAIQGYVLEHTTRNGFFAEYIDVIATNTNTSSSTTKRALKHLLEIDFFRIYKKATKGYPTIYMINPSFGYFGRRLAGQKQFKIYESLPAPLNGTNKYTLSGTTDVTSSYNI